MLDLSSSVSRLSITCDQSVDCSGRGNMLDPITITVGVVTFAAAFAYMKSRRPDKTPPGPWPWPFFGNVRMVTGTKKFHFKAEEMFRKYGPVSSLQMAFYPAILLSDVKSIREALLHQPDFFSDKATWLPFVDMINKKGLGVAFANGETHKLHKKLILHSMRELGFGSTTLEEKIHHEVLAILEELKKNEKKEYDFQILFNMATANVICAVLYGKRYEYNDAEFRHLLHGLNSIMKNGGLQNIFFFLPGFFMLFMPIINPKILFLLNVQKGFYQHITDKIEEHKASIDKGNPRDLIDIFIEEGRSDDDLRQVVSELYLAGSETTSTTLLWAFLFMIKDPDVQEKCRREITEVVGNDRFPSYKDRDSLPFVSATILEVQRIANVVPLGIFRNCNHATTLNGYSIPKDTIVFVNTYSVHMDPVNFPDPEQFKPERFLSPDKKTVTKPEAFMAFSIGRRACLGENLAKMELFLIFSALIQKFRFRAVDPDKLPTLKDCTLGVTVIPNPYSIKFESV